MENQNRHIFSIHGITGMLIATVLLISILVVLTYFGLKAQQDVAQKPYKITDPSAIKMKSVDNIQYKVVKE